MINYDGWSTAKVIFSWNGTTLKQTWPNVLVVLLIGITTNVICTFTGYLETLDTSAQQMPLIFVAILLVFRTGYAYGRFMEGRGHVGTMVFNVRDLARMLATFVQGEDPATNFDRSNTVRLLHAFVIANRLSCRKEEAAGGEGFTELEKFLTNTEAARLKEIKKNYPVQILQWVGKSLVKFKDKQMFARAIDTMEEKVGELLGAWMGMQKLATTPFPFPYAQMCTFFLYLWCYTCPIAMALSNKWYGCVIASAISFALFGINCIALELEDPFGTETNDLELEFFEGASMSACKALLPPECKPEEIEPKPGVEGGPNVTNGSSPGIAASPLKVDATSPGVPAMGSPASDPTAITNDPNFGPRAQAELRTASNLAGCSPELQAVFKGFFDRYDFSGNGRIDSNKELTQLATNLMFSLKLGSGLPKLLEQVDAAGQNPDWDLNQFVEWFLAACKNGALP